MLDSIGSNPTSDPGGGKAAKPAKRVPSAETIDWEVRDIKRRYKRWRATAAENALAIIDIGERLAKLKGEVEAAYSYGHWTEFVASRAEDLPPIRTCQKFMAGAEAKDDPLLSTDPMAWAAKVWGNKPKPKGGDRNAVDGASDKKREDDNKADNRQSGGHGFSPGFFPDQGKPAFTGFKNLARYLNEAFFESPAITATEKLRFIEETVAWLEGRWKAIAARNDQIEKTE